MTTETGPQRASVHLGRLVERWASLPGARSRRTSASPASPDAAAPSRPALILPGGGALAIAAIGLALGLSATALVVARGWDPGAVAIGPWVALPQVGSPAIDPYARAELARSGRLPLASGEGLAFSATTDDTGYRLVATCIYRVAGVAPAARFWTLTANGPDGAPLDVPARRSAFTSSEVLRDLDGRFTVTVAPVARPGNWLPVAGRGTLTLWLRLYDTPLAGNAGETAGAVLPAITRLSCAAPATAETTR